MKRHGAATIGPEASAAGVENMLAMSPNGRWLLKYVDERQTAIPRRPGHHGRAILREIQMR